MSEENLNFAATDGDLAAGAQDMHGTAGGETIVVAEASGDPVPLDTQQGVSGATPPADFPDTVTPDAQNVVHLPAGVSIDDIRIEGLNIVLVQPDGQEIVIPNAALNIPTFIIGNVEIPHVVLVAAFEANGIEVAAGPDGSSSVVGAGPNSSGGNFSQVEGGIGDSGVNLMSLLGDTEFGGSQNQNGLLLGDTNHDVEIRSGEQSGEIFESADNPGGIDPDPTPATGTIEFFDFDQGDTRTASITASEVVTSDATLTPAQSAAFLAGFSLDSDATGGITSEPSGSTNGTVDWTYRLDNGAVDFLAAGETVHLSFEVSISDGIMTVVQNVTITITGTNDAPVIDAIAARNLVEQTDSSVISTTVPVTFGDVDLNDVGHTASVTQVVATGEVPSGVTAGTTLTAGALLGLLTTGTVTKSAGSDTGSLQADFAAGSDVFDYLAAGETVTLTYTIAIDDGDGGVGTREVAITVTGTNDAPVIEAGGIVGGSVTELADNSVVPPELTTDLTASGAIAFSDVDLSDIHNATATLVSAIDSINGVVSPVGVFTPTVTDDTTGDGVGTIGWNFTVNDGAADYLAAGQTITQVYAVTVADANAGAATQNVTITITGTNDAPVIDAVAAVTLSEPDTSALSTTIPVTFTDVDLADTGHAASVTQVVVDGQLAGGTASAETQTSGALFDLLLLGAVAKADGSSAGSLDAHFDAPAGTFDYLRAGETLDLTYTIQVDDGDGGVTTQDITITITGTNDLPTVDTVTALTVDEDLLPGGLAGDAYGNGGDATPDTLHAAGSLNITWGADDYSHTDPAHVDGVVQFTGARSDVGSSGEPLGTSRGQTIESFISADGKTITGFTGPVLSDGSPDEAAGARIVFVATVDEQGTGSYSFDLRDVIDHPVSGTEDDATLSFDLSVVDTNGATVPHSFAVIVDDDGPTTAGYVGSVTVSEDADAATGAFVPQTAGGFMTFDGGADGAKITGLHYGPMSGSTARVYDADAGNSPVVRLDLTSGHEPVLVSEETSAGGLPMLVGKLADGTEIFTLEVTDAQTGAYTFTQLGPIDHPDQGESGTADPVRMDVSFTVTDGDGDTARGHIHVDINDDGPTTAGETSQVSVNEDDLDNAGAGNFFGVFDVIEGSTGTSPDDGHTDRSDYSGVAGPILGSVLNTLLNGSTYADGSLANTVDFGADGAGGFSLKQGAVDGLAAQGLTSGGVAVEYTSITVSQGSFAGSLVLGYVSNIPDETIDVIFAALQNVINGDPISIPPGLGLPSDPEFRLVFALGSQENGSYQFRLFDQLDHAAADNSATTGINEDTHLVIDFSALFEAKDGDGDTTGLPGGTFTVEVEDDAPIANRGELGRVEDEALPGGNQGDPDGPGGEQLSASVHDVSLNIDWGADDGNTGGGGTGDRSVVFTDNKPDVNGTYGTTLTSGGEQVRFVLLDGGTTFVGYTGSTAPGSTSDAGVVFYATLSDAGRGSYDFTLVQPLDHGGGTTEVSFIFNYTATDSDGDAAANTFTVRVVDDAPVAEDVASAMSENEVHTVTLVEGTDYSFGADTHGAAISLGAPVFTGVPAGVVLGTPTVTLGADGHSVVINPGTAFDALSEGASTVMHIPYTVTDGDGDSVTKDIAVTVTGTNDQPDITVATGDSAYQMLTETNAGLTAAGTLSVGDVDVTDVVNATVLSVSAGGSGIEHQYSNAELLGFLTVGANPVIDGTHTTGQIAWTFDSQGEAFDFLRNGWESTLDYTIQVSDGHGGTDTQVVRIKLHGTNDAPVATGESYAIDEDHSLTIDAATGVLGNDNDADAGASLTAVLATGPSHGSLTLNADGSFTYTPNADFNGTDSFTYKPNDGSADGNVATVNITVNAVNDAPVLSNVSDMSVPEDSTLYIRQSQIWTASDPDGAAAEVTLTLHVEEGEGVLSASRNGLSGSFHIDVQDGGKTLVITTQADAGGSRDAYAILNSLLRGDNFNATTNPNGIAFTPDHDWNGAAKISYELDDHGYSGTGGSKQANGDFIIDVTPVNDAPVAADDSYSTDEDTPLTISAAGILANDTDVDSGVLNAALVTGPANGALTLNADGSFTYTPNADFNGTDSFTYKPNDGSADGNTATVSITVNAVNDAPVITSNNGGDTATIDVAENTTAVTTVTSTDIDGGTPIYSIVGGADQVLFSIDASTGDLSFISEPDHENPEDADFDNIYEVEVQVSDGNGSTDTQIISASVTDVPENVAPETENTSVGGAEDGARIAITLSGSDINGNLSGFVIQSLPQHGALYASETGGAALALSDTVSGTLPLTVYFQPDADWSGQTSFQYAAIDADGAVDATPATATIDVAPVADMPVLGLSVAGQDMPVLFDELTVNERPGLTQTEPQITVLDDGRIVATWYSLDTLADNDSAGIAARVGMPQSDGSIAWGDEFTVNVEIASEQKVPQVTALGGDRLVFTWQSPDPDVDTDGSGISGRIVTLHDDGSQTWGDEFTVNFSIGEHQFDPQVTALGGGRLIFTWHDNAQHADSFGAGIAARIGTPQADGSMIWGHQFLVNSEQQGLQSRPQVTALDDGRVVFTWESDDRTGEDASRSHISARIGTPQVDGSMAWGNEFTVNSEWASWQYKPQVTALDDGRLVFTWESDDFADEDTSSTHVSARIGAPQAGGTIAWAGDEFTVNTEGQGKQYQSQVTELGDGRLVFTWTSFDTTGTDASLSHISGRVGTPQADGSMVWSDEFTVNVEAESLQEDPQITVLADGRLMFIWGSQDPDVDGSDYGIAARIIDPNGHAVEDTPFDLDVTAALGDTDGSESFTALSLKGIPAGFVLSDGTHNATSSGDADPINLLGWDLTSPLHLTPFGDFNGTIAITLTAEVTDTASTGSDTVTNTTSFSIDIAPVNDAPVITSNGGGDTATVDVAENTTAVTTVTSTDIDGGTPIYSIVGGADQALFSIDDSTGDLSFVSAPDYENALDADSDNIYEVEVQVSDGHTGADTQTITVNVTNAVENVAPVLALNSVSTTDAYVLDRFETTAYNNNDGSANWATDWAETGDDGSAEIGYLDPDADIGIVSDGGFGNHSLSFNDRAFSIFSSDGDNDDAWVERSVDLTGATTATLSFDYRRDLSNGNDHVLIQIADSSGGTFTTLLDLKGNQFDSDYQHKSIDISAYVSDDTTIRIVADGRLEEVDTAWIDNVRVDYMTTTITGTTDFETTFVEDGAAVSIAAAGPTISDDGTTIHSARIELTNAQAGDLLTVGSLSGGITSDIDTSQAGKIVVTLSGNATLADYEAAIKGVTFENGRDDLSTDDRVIHVTVNDGLDDSNVATSTVHVTATNDAPTAHDDIVISNYGNNDLTVPDWAFLANDIDPDGDALRITDVENNNFWDSVTHAADDHVAIEDGWGNGGQFTYTLKDSADVQETASVTFKHEGGFFNDITGGNQDEILVGDGGSDTFKGNGGDDVILAGGGDDTLFGGTGHNMLSGGDDADTFVIDPSALSSSDIADFITDYSQGDGDKVDLGALLDTLAPESHANDAAIRDTVSLSDDGTNTNISVDTNGSADGGEITVATLAGVHTAVTILYHDQSHAQNSANVDH